MPPPMGVTYDAKHPHLRCIVFIRPTRESVNLLQSELENPRYGSYQIHFTNIVEPGKGNKKTMLADLARADKNCLVASLSEYYGDYYAIQDILFTLDQSADIRHYRRDANMANLERTVQGLSSFLLSHKRMACVRYQQASEPCKRLASELSRLVEDQEPEVHGFQNQKYGVPLLLIWDRREDPLTPLLKPWTYQAMLHEYIGIRHNTVDLAGLPGAKSRGADGEEDVTKHMFVLNPGWAPPSDEMPSDPGQDDFYGEHMYSDYATVGEQLAKRIEDYQAKNSPGDVKGRKEEITLEELQDLASNMPELRRMTGIISKHLDFMQQFKRTISSRHIWEGSVLEQELAADPDLKSKDSREKIMELAENGLRIKDLVRLVMLHTLKYDKIDDKMMQLLQEHGADAEQMSMPERLLSYSDATKRDDWNKLFRKPDSSSWNPVKFAKQVKAKIKGLGEFEDNVSDYMRHKPLIVELMEAAFEGNLDEHSFPVKCGQEVVHPKEVIIFVVGGATYAEAAAVAQWNKMQQEKGDSKRVVLGSTCMHSSDSFEEMLCQLE